MAPSGTKRRKSTFSLFYAERSILSITYGRGDDMAHASRPTISTPPMTSSEREAVGDAANERAEGKTTQGPRIDERKSVGTRLSTSFTRSSGYMSNIVRRITSVVKRLRRRELRLGR